jgi:tRNA modification GTPase
MRYNLFDTIVAISTSKGSAGIGIVRVSGNLSLVIASKLSKKKCIKKGVNYASFFDFDSGLIDKGLILFFKKPKSFTGEDVVEFHVHGSDIILNALVFRCVELGARTAYNGEFSFRAFLNNKFDLVQVEAVNSLIKSNSLNSNKFIFKSLFGKFSDSINEIILELNNLKLELEASIEFPDNVNFSFDKFYSAFFLIHNKYMNIFNSVISDECFFNSLNVVIFGNVNVGKSSLFNFLLKSNRAIVSELPGTTRDFIESNFILNGFKFNLIDTAGFNSLSKDFLETVSIERTFSQVKIANVLVFVVDVIDNSNFLEDENFKKALVLSKNKLKLIVLKNKIDLLNIGKNIIYHKDYVEILISVKTGEGIDLLLNELSSIFNSLTENIYFVNKRQFDLLLNIKNYFNFLIIYNDIYKPLDVYAETIGIIIFNLRNILGVDVSNDILFDIFSNFCVGK